MSQPLQLASKGTSGSLSMALTLACEPVKKHLESWSCRVK
jgi:hypothetical protein